MCQFRIGQKVVCVNDDNSPVLKLGLIYTITSVIDLMLPTGLGIHDTGVTVSEVKPSGGYNGFAASRFRPLVTRKTDISCFTAMLTPKTVEVVA